MNLYIGIAFLQLPAQEIKAHLMTTSKCVLRVENDFMLFVSQNKWYILGFPRDNISEVPCLLSFFRYQRFSSCLTG